MSKHNESLESLDLERKLGRGLQKAAIKSAGNPYEHTALYRTVVFCYSFFIILYIVTMWGLKQ